MESSCCGADIHWSGPLGPSVEPQLPLSAFKFRQAVCAVNVFLRNIKVMLFTKKSADTLESKKSLNVPPTAAFEKFPPLQAGPEDESQQCDEKDLQHAEAIATLSQ